MKTAVAVAVALVVTCSGCAPQAAQDVPTLAPLETVTPTPTPTSVSSKPELSELVLSPDGLGPLLVGQAPPVTDPAIDILVFDVDHCADDEESIMYGVPAGKWVANYEPALSSNTNDPFGVFVNDDGVVELI